MPIKVTNPPFKTPQSINSITMSFNDGTTRIIDMSNLGQNVINNRDLYSSNISKGQFPIKISCKNMGFFMITSDIPVIPVYPEGVVPPPGAGPFGGNPLYNGYLKTFHNLPGDNKDIIEAPEFYNIWNKFNWRFYVFPILTKRPLGVPAMLKKVDNFEGFSDTTDDIEEFSGTASNIILLIVIIAIIAAVYFNYNRIRNYFNLL
jgi:hypothetical protein